MSITMSWSPAIILLLHVAVLLSTSPTTTTTTAFTIHTSSITSTYSTTITSSSSSSVLYGSIYAPGSDKEDEEGLNRDHLGRLVPKSDDKGATSSPTSSSSSSATSTTSTTSTTTPVTTPKKVPIRFINFDTIGGQERVAYAEPNANILKVADEAGVKIPRQCRSGLCGSCTTDVKDPTWTEGERLGYQTVRACQAGAILPAGCEEMVLDCFRIGSSSSGVAGVTGTGVTVESGSVSMDKKPFMNFEDGWEDDFSPDYKTTSPSTTTTTTTASSSSSSSSSSTSKSENGTIEVVKKTTPEFTVKHGERSTIEIEKPHWTPRIDANIPPWETVW